MTMQTATWLPYPPAADAPPARLGNVHPGEILRAEFLAPLGLTPAGLARATGMPADDARRLARGECAVTLDTARRLSRRLGTSVVFWLRLQAAYDREEEDASSHGSRTGG